ncbi:MAG TPA: hypothetical protein VGD84_22945 [Pseudonocardiaceae bacterium]
MQDNHDADAVPAPDETEAAAGEVTTPRRFGIGARTSLLLGLTAIGIATVAAGWPSVSQP